MAKKPGSQFNLGDVWVQSFNTRDDSYFAPLEVQKNGGVKGLLLDLEYSRKPKNYSVNKLDFRLWRVLEKPEAKIMKYLESHPKWPSTASTLAELLVEAGESQLAGEITLASMEADLTPKTNKEVKGYTSSAASSVNKAMKAIRNEYRNKPMDDADKKLDGHLRKALGELESAIRIIDGWRL